MQTLPGTPYPFGATVTAEGVNFSVYAENCELVSLCLFQENHAKEPFFELALEDAAYRTGDTWHVLVQGLPESFLYGYKVTREGQTHLLLDPYATCVASEPTWSEAIVEKKPYQPLGKVFCHHRFDWEKDKPLNLSRESLVIYEMHVRGFTRLCQDVSKPGTFQGLIEKIPYLVDLGVNAVELLPIHEFDETDVINTHPESNRNLHNYFGYSTVNFFSPMNRYASNSSGDHAIIEFKSLVKELHKNKIEVILDVVFNHTFEGNEKGPILSFKGFNPFAYYMINEKNEYLNFSGCGNTFNCNHPVTRELIIAALRYWVVEMHVDGFRFDLASVFNRASDGTPLVSPPLMEAISQDPVLKHTKLIAEPWDCAMYQVGFFSNFHPKWSEWNGKYRDDVRKFLKGTGSKKDFADALCGSRMVYENAKNPWCSVNFVTIHDGFSLKDLVTYNEKHNEANGEENRDGSNNNESWNCGQEGDTENEGIIFLRRKQMRNYMVALFVSQGIPMIQMGDEYGHTKGGNNNSWCQDNEMNWFDWTKLKQSGDFLDFVKALIRFRKEHVVFQKKEFFEEQDVKWHGLKPFQPEWDNENSLIALTIHSHDQEEPLIYVAFNASFLEQTYEIPPLSEGKTWNRFVDTGVVLSQGLVAETPFKIEENKVAIGPYSSIILKASADV